MKNMKFLDLVNSAVGMIKSTVPDADIIFEKDEERLRFWVEHILNTDPERLEWHIGRLQGFGGSDIGPLAIELIHNGYAALPGHHARNVIAQKLCLEVPKRPTFAMRVGTLIEPDAKKVLIERILRAGGRVDSEAHAAIRRWNSDLDLRLAKGEKFKYMVGEPDLIFVIDNLRYVTDIKYSSDKADTAILEEYVYQVHHYAKILEEGLDLPVHGLRLSKYVPDDDGYPEAKTFVVHKEQARYQDIENAIAIASDFRIKGMLPPYQTRSIPNISDPEELKTIADYTNEYFSWSTIEKKAKEQKEKIRGQVESLANQLTLDFGMDNRMKGSLGTLRVGLMNIGFSLNINTQSLLEELITKGAIKSADEVTSKSKELDQDRVMHFIQEHCEKTGLKFEDVLSSLSKMEIDEDKLMKIAVNEFGDDPIPGVIQQIRLSESKSKGVGIEECRELAESNLAGVSRLIKAQADINTTGSLAKPSPTKKKATSIAAPKVTDAVLQATDSAPNQKPVESDLFNMKF